MVKSLENLYNNNCQSAIKRASYFLIEAIRSKSTQILISDDLPLGKSDYWNDERLLEFSHLIKAYEALNAVATEEMETPESLLDDIAENTSSILACIGKRSAP